MNEKQYNKLKDFAWFLWGLLNITAGLIAIVAPFTDISIKLLGLFILLITFINK